MHEFYIDAEYILSNKQNFVNIGKSTINYFTYDETLFGLLYDDNIEFFNNITICDILNKIFEFGYNSARVYSYFTTAELSCHNANFYNKLLNYGIEIAQVIKKGKSYQITFNKDKQSLTLLDIMHVNGGGSLDDFCLTFLKSSPKDYLRSKNIQHDANIMKNLTYKELIEYNSLDLKYTRDAYQVFINYMLDFIRSNFGIEINTKNIRSLGGFVSRTLKELSQLYNETILLEFYQNYYNSSKSSHKSNNIIEELQRLGSEAYMGGGMILNFLPARSIINTCYVYDIVSLYPISALLMSQQAPKSRKDIYKTTPNINMLEDYHYHGFVWAKIKYIGHELPYSPVRDVVDSKQIALYYPKIIERWFTFDELRTLVYENQDYQILDLNCNDGENWGRDMYFWSNTRNMTIYQYFSKLLENKVKINKKEDPIKYQLNKLLLNIAYGKLVEKADEDYMPSIFSPLLGAYLTSISRLIMYILHKNYHGLHYATDSIFLDHEINDDSPLIVSQIIEKMGYVFPNFYKKLLECDVNNERMNIIRTKVYYTDNFKKEAHHAIHARADQVKQILPKLMADKHNILLWCRESYISWNDLEKLHKEYGYPVEIFNYAFLPTIEQYMTFYSFDTYYKDGKAFETIDQAIEYKKRYKKERSSIERKLQKMRDKNQTYVEIGKKNLFDYRHRRVRFIEIP